MYLGWDKVYDRFTAQPVPGKVLGILGIEMAYAYSRISLVLNTLDMAKSRFGLV